MTALLLSPATTRELGSAGRGQFAAATTLVLITATIATAGLQDASTVFVARHGLSPRGWLRQMRPVIGPVTVAAVIGVVATSLWLLPGLGRTGAAVVALGVVVQLLFNWVAGLVAGLGDVKSLSRMTWVPAAARLCSILALFVLGDMSVLAAVAVFAAAPLLGLAAVDRDLLRDDQDRSSEPHRAALLRYALMTAPGTIASVLLLRVDQVLGLHVMGAAALGLYSVAAGLAQFPQTLATAARQVVLTRTKTAGSTLLGQIATLGVASTLMAVCVAGVTPLLATFVFGPEFKGLFAPTAVLCLGVPAWVLVQALGPVLLLRGRARVHSAGLFAGAVANLLLILLLCGRLDGGATGAAAASSLAYSLTAGWMAVATVRTAPVALKTTQEQP